MRFDQAIQPFEGQPLTRQLLMGLLKDYRRPYDKINELVKSGELQPIKRGVFIVGKQLNLAGPEPFLLANHLLGPSYVSLSSALAYWGMIPEKVFHVSSMTTQRSKEYATAVGLFRYSRLPLPWYSYGQQAIKLAENQVALIASKEKALCDSLIATAGLQLRSTVQAREWLLKDLRMDREALATLQPAVIQSWMQQAPKQNSLEILVKTLEEL